jgi:ER-bound oxygenase mpaB/B'/Rubber oxygenase, catalytic domain
MTRYAISLLTSNLNKCIDTFMTPTTSRGPRTEFWSPRYKLGGSVRRLIAKLDPEQHDAEITHLSSEVLTPPVMAHIGYVNASARTVAVPHVARTVFREGTGDQILRPWERDADTLTFFGELMRRGHRSAEGIAACKRIEQIHRAVGGVLNEDKVYTLALMIHSPQDLALAMGRPIHSDVENRALHSFWMGVGRAMGVRDVPETPDELRAWAEEYEAKHFEPSTEAHEVSEAHIRAIEHWFPGPSKWLARAIYIGSLDERVAECLGYEPSKKPFAALMRAGWLSFAAAGPLLPVRLDSSWVKSFSRVGPEPDLERIGYGTYAAAHAAPPKSSLTTETG